MTEPDQKEEATRARRLVIDPNRDSDVSVLDGCALAMSRTVPLGVPSEFRMDTSPYSPMRVVKLSTCVPRGMFYISDMSVGNMNVTLGSGEIDAALLGDMVVGWPPMSTSTTLRVRARYSGLVPKGVREAARRTRLTVAAAYELLRSLDVEKNDAKVRERIREALARTPVFTFSLVASGPAIPG